MATRPGADLESGPVLVGHVDRGVDGAGGRVGFQIGREFLRVLAASPVACVLLGVLLEAAGLDDLFRAGTGFDTTTRLQGASIPDQLSLSSFVGAVTASTAFVSRAGAGLPPRGRRRGDSWPHRSRGASIALGLAMLWPALRFPFGAAADRSVTRRWTRITALVAVVGFVVGFAVPALLSRNSVGTYYEGVGSSTTRPVAGRSPGRSFTRSKKSALFGDGLGPDRSPDSGEGFSRNTTNICACPGRGLHRGRDRALRVVVVIGMCIVRSPRLVASTCSASRLASRSSPTPRTRSRWSIYRCPSAWFSGS